MDLKHLESFIEVAKRLNFSRAAEELGIAQPVVSRHIAQLEDEMRLKLFERNRRSVRLTPGGELFFTQVQSILQQLTQAARDARAVERGKGGRVSIGYLGSTAAATLPPLLRAFREDHPQMELLLYEMTPYELVDALNNGKIDVAFNRPLQDALLAPFHRLLLCRDRYVVALPEAHPLAQEATVDLRKLNRESFVLPRRETAPALFDTGVATCHRAGFSPRVVVDAITLQGVLTTVAGGGVVSLVPSCVRFFYREGVVLRDLKGSPMRFDFEMHWCREGTSAGAEKLITMMKRHAPQLEQVLHNSPLNDVPREIVSLWEQAGMSVMAAAT